MLALVLYVYMYTANGLWCYLVLFYYTNTHTVKFKCVVQFSGFISFLNHSYLYLIELKYLSKLSFRFYGLHLMVCQITFSVQKLAFSNCYVWVITLYTIKWHFHKTWTILNHYIAWAYLNNSLHEGLSAVVVVHNNVYCISWFTSYTSYTFPSMSVVSW